MRGFAKYLNTRYGELIFGLLCGCSYFVIALDFIMSNTHAGGLLLALFCAPVIICGVALVFIKILRSWYRNEQYGNINSFAGINLMIFIIAVFFVVDFCIHGLR